MIYTRTLRYQLPLSQGEDVLAVQQALITLNVSPKCTSADGVFGPVTASSVKGFQHSYNVTGRGSGLPLPESGEVDLATWKALFNGGSDAAATPSPHENIDAAPVGQSDAVTDPVTPCLNPTQVHQVRDWMIANFATLISIAIANTPIDESLVYAIACQETASAWLPWLGRMSAQDILARCVFDASGDAVNATRSAFPRDTPAFRERMGDELTEMLIAEANATRALSNRSAARWVYKGYGIFQYDLQNILDDREFFEQRQWYRFGPCMDRFMQQMAAKLAAAGGDLGDAVRRYNGSGPSADRYAAAVMKMREWCAG